MAPLSGAVMPWYAAHVKTFLALLIEQAEKEQCAGSAQWHNASVENCTAKTR